MTLFVEEQDRAGASGLRVLKEPGNPEWCWQTVSYLQTIWKHLDLDYNRYIAAWSEAEQHKVWEKVPYDSPFGSKEEMLKRLELGDDKQAQRRIEVQPIAHKVRRKYGLGRGGDRRSKEFQHSPANFETPKYGANPDYLLGRILNTRPDIFERWERGEFPSAAAAAAAAGIEWVQRPKTLTLSQNVERVADRLRAHYTPDELQRIRDRLDAEEVVNEAQDG